MSLGYHLTLRLADDRVLASDVAALRRAAACLHRHGRAARLLAFCVVDTHVHALVACDVEMAKRFARGISIALQKTLAPGVPFERARVRPIVDQRHLYNTFYYLVRQHQHHGVRSDPFHDGSHYPDVAGLRVVDLALEAAVRGLLPRMELELPPRGDLRAEHLVEAAAAALALRDLRTKSTASVMARAAVVHLGQGGHDTRQLAELLGLDRSTVNRLRLIGPPRGLVRAVEGQARWRAATSVTALPVVA